MCVFYALHNILTHTKKEIEVEDMFQFIAFLSNYHNIENVKAHSSEIVLRYNGKVGAIN